MKRKDQINRRLALSKVGGLGEPSKMPGKSWGISARHCHVGGKLAEKEGTICSKCYALRHFYMFANVQSSLDRRLELFNQDPIGWTKAMIHLVQYELHFRWFDTGDVQSVKMLRCIFDVCEGTPKTSHWLPTKEHGMVRHLLEYRPVPRNLVIRLSGYKFDGNTPDTLAAKLGVNVSGAAVLKYGDKWETGHTCQAREQMNQCGTCRACWDPQVYKVVYPKH